MLFNQKESIQIGKSILDAQPRHISEVQRGLLCNCTCFECGAKLSAAQGLIRSYHFKHHEAATCSGGQETALHQLAKKILIDAKGILLHNIGEITYENGRAEEPFEQFRPDVTADFDNTEKICFEVRVTNPTAGEKVDFYKKKQIRSVEIDIYDFLNKNFDLNDLKDAVLVKPGNKEVFYWPPNMVAATPQKLSSTINDEEGNSLFAFILMIVFGFFFYIFLNTRRNSYARKYAGHKRKKRN
jgi:hypothetical protein